MAIMGTKFFSAPWRRGRPNNGVAWEVAHATSVGGRTEQQDRVDWFDLPNGMGRMVALADGLGGHGGGAMAAQAVLDAAGALAADGPSSDTPGAKAEFLSQILLAAHRDIRNLPPDVGRSPRTTGVLLVVGPNACQWAHVGDSRLYRFSKDGFTERTSDHSVVQMLVDLGKISEDEMRTHADQNKLLRTLGGDDDPEPDIGEAEALPGSGFILCTDGLWENVTIDEMETLLREGNLQYAVELAVRLAVERGGENCDNTTAAMARTVVG